MITLYCDRINMEFYNPNILQFKRKHTKSGEPYFILVFKDKHAPDNICQLYFMAKYKNSMFLGGHEYKFDEIVKNPDLIESLINKEKTKMILDNLP